MINVAGKVRNPFRFELKNSTALGSELIDYAPPLAKASQGRDWRSRQWPVLGLCAL
jgi:hypothetical protein